MEKHEDNLDKLLKAELEKEAGEIMEEMDSDESLQDISFPEDLDEKMWSKIQEYEEQQKAYENGQMPTRRQSVSDERFRRFAEGKIRRIILRKMWRVTVI